MSASKKGLGRGFEALIPVDLLDESFDPTANQDKQVSELRQIKIDEISADPDQPRRKFGEEELRDLADSIKEHGILQPIIVTPYQGGYKIVAGERRFRASKIAGITKIPALVRKLSDQHKLEISLIENLQRQDLNVMETATAYLKLRDQFNLSLDEIGKRVGNRSISAVSNTMRLMKLPDFAKQALVDGQITEGQIRPLIGFDVKAFKQILPRIIKENWNARKIEQYVVSFKRSQNGELAVVSKRSIEQPYREQIDRLKKRLKADVKIQANSKGAGKITISFKNETEFKRLQEIIG